jgi:hypothetical protein
MLQSQQYGRLAKVSRYLGLFSDGQWNRLGNDERILFIEKMDNDFNFRAWDDMEAKAGGAYSRLTELLYHQKRSL